MTVLTHLSFGLWLIGVIGMYVARAVFGEAPGDTAFGVFASLFGTGGLAYFLLGSCYVLAARREREAVPGRDARSAADATHRVTAAEWKERSMTKLG